MRLTQHTLVDSTKVEIASNAPIIESDYLELARIKLQLVERDYESYFQAAFEVTNRIYQLRGLEVTLISAVSVVLLTQGTFPPSAVTPLYLFIAVFYALNVDIFRGFLLIQEDVVKVEEKIGVDNLVDFTKNVAAWTFGNTVVMQRSPKQQVRCFFKALFSPEILVWHGGLLMVTWLLLSA